MTALKIVFLLAAPLKVKTRGGDKILLDCQPFLKMSQNK